MRRGGHLRAAGLAARLVPARARRWLAFAAAAVLLPWSATLLWLAVPQIVQSLAQQERFAETLNPGYFVIRLAMGLLLLLIGAQSLIDAWGAVADREPR